MVIVNEALARRQWPSEDPVGQTLTAPMTVIGPMVTVMRSTTFQVVGVETIW